jgi:hypothetical protein
MKKVLCLLALSTFAFQPVMADHHEGEMKDSTIEQAKNLNEKQKKALKQYQQSMKADHERMKKEKEMNKAQWEANQAKKKEAFIEGDFKRMEKLQDEMRKQKMDRKDKMADENIDNMKDAFGDLTKEERAEVAEMVIKGKKNMPKVREHMKNRKEK